MLRLCAIAIAVFTASPLWAQDIPDFDNSFAGGEDGQIIVFVGEKIAIDELSYEEHCVSEETNDDGEPVEIICMDAAFNARYKVIDLLKGDYSGRTIDFRVYDHYGEPRFLEHDRVILYVVQEGNTLYHKKYQFDPLYRLSHSDYAFCGDPYLNYSKQSIKKNGRKDLVAFRFTPAVTFKLSDHLISEEDLHEYDQEDIRDNYVETMTLFAPPAFEIEGDIASCKMGLPPSDIIDIRFKFEFNPAEKYNEAHDKCWDASGLERSKMHTFAERKTSGFNTCKNKIPELNIWAD